MQRIEERATKAVTWGDAGGGATAGTSGGATITATGGMWGGWDRMWQHAGTGAVVPADGQGSATTPHTPQQAAAGTGSDGRSGSVDHHPTHQATRAEASGSGDGTTTQHTTDT